MSAKYRDGKHTVCLPSLPRQTLLIKHHFLTILRIFLNTELQVATYWLNLAHYDTDLFIFFDIPDIMLGMVP